MKWLGLLSQESRFFTFGPMDQKWTKVGYAVAGDIGARDFLA